MTIKVERYLLITRQGGCIEITPASSTYLLVPAELKEELKNKYGIDLVKDRKNVAIETSLVEERTDENNPFEIKIIHSIRKFPKPSRR